MLRKTLLLALCLFLSGCLQSPQFSHQKTEFRLISFQEVVALSKFSISNPNLIPLKGVIDYKVEVNNKRLASGETEPIDIGSQSQADTIIETKLNLVEVFGALSGMVDALVKGQTELPYRLTGNYRTTMTGINLSVPLKAEGKLGLPKLPKIELQNISVEALDLQNMALKIKAKVNNVNNIPLTLDKMVYVLNSGEKSLGEGSLVQEVNIPAGGEASIEWNAKVNIANIDKKLITNILNNPNSLVLQSYIQGLR